VFSSISGALTGEQASKFNFAAQQKLHDEIIDDGLKALYEKRITKGIERLGSAGDQVKKEVLTGKVFPQLSHYASFVRASLVVVGRYGVHKEDISVIGSTAHALARICPTNLLIVDTPRASSSGQATALGRASASIEATGSNEAPHKAEALSGSGNPLTLKSDLKEAVFVTLKKAKKLAPSFHEHIVKARIVGAELEVGSRYMVFDVVGTEPSGRVRVTERTRLEFV
jgi:nucleotide-binding universal stress UspA family protein